MRKKLDAKNLCSRMTFDQAAPNISCFLILKLYVFASAPPPLQQTLLLHQGSQDRHGISCNMASARLLQTSSIAQSLYNIIQ